MNPNPYAQEGQYNFSAKQMKQQQKNKDISNIAPSYLPPPGQTPYSMLHKQSYDTMKSENKLMSGQPPMVAGANYGYSTQQINLYASPPPPPPQMMVIQGPGGKNFCRFCHSSAGVVDTQVMGCAVISWSIVLCCLTGCCCWIPFVVDGCFDRQIRCMQCGGTQQVIKSQFGI